MTKEKKGHTSTPSGLSLSEQPFYESWSRQECLHLVVGLELLLLMVEVGALDSVWYGAKSSESRLAMGLPAGLNTGSGLVRVGRLDGENCDNKPLAIHLLQCRVTETGAEGLGPRQTRNCEVSFSQQSLGSCSPFSSGCVCCWRSWSQPRYLQGRESALTISKTISTPPHHQHHK